MGGLWPRLWHIRFGYDLLGSVETQFLDDAAFRALTNLLASAAAGLVWTYTEPGDGSLRDDDKLLAQHARMSLRQWKKVRPEVERFFVSRGGRWHLNRPWIEVGSSTRLAIPRDVQAIVAAREGAWCSYCGATGVELEYDHIFPLSRGGSDDPSNLTLACAPCNQSKGARTLQEWFDAKR